MGKHNCQNCYIEVREYKPIWLLLTIFSVYSCRMFINIVNDYYGVDASLDLRGIFLIIYILLSLMGGIISVILVLPETTKKKVICNGS